MILPSASQQAIFIIHRTLSAGCSTQSLTTPCHYDQILDVKTRLSDMDNGTCIISNMQESWYEAASPYRQD
jgi:hypothetical protein